MKYVVITIAGMLTACAGKPVQAPHVGPHPGVPGIVLDLHRGHLTEIADAGFSLGFVLAVEDSRCPTNVTCVHQGRFLGKFLSLSLLTEGGPSQNYVFLMSTERGCSEPECGPFIFTGNPQGELGSVYYAVVIEDVFPRRIQGQEILEPYRVRLRITNGSWGIRQ